MSPSETSISVLRGEEVSFTNEARSIQYSALARQCRVVKLGQVIFFSTATGDAWMLDPEGGSAACLARDGEFQRLPIHENATQFKIDWNADYRIENDAFTVTERNGSVRTIRGYPTAEIERLTHEYPSGPKEDFSEVTAARERHDLGRNDPCPCGSGRKYKKCCLPKDEELIRKSSALRRTQEIRRAEIGALSALPASDSVVDHPAPFPEEDFVGVDKVDLPLEVQAELDELWDEFEALKHPTADQMNALLNRLLALPAEGTLWSDLFHQFARLRHADLPGVFRRIADAVPHTKDAGMSFFYWAAAEEFIRCGNSNLLPEVAANFRRLDRRSYDADAMAHLEDYLLVEGFEAELLGLAEHFLPILRADDDLMPFVVPTLCSLIFELRVGRCLRSELNPQSKIEILAEELRRGMEEDIHPNAARHSADIIIGQVPVPAWTRSQFELVSGDIATDDRAWRECLRLFGALIQVAREAWQLEQHPPGCALRGLTAMLGSAYHWLHAKPKKRKAGFRNMLDCLQPHGLEERLVCSCRDLIGINEAKARLLLQAHGHLFRFASRHELIPGADRFRTERELNRLRHELDHSRAQ